MAPKKKGKHDKKLASKKSVASKAPVGEPPPQEEITLNSQTSGAPPSKEALKSYIEAGGQKCLDLFQYLSTSTEWYKCTIYMLIL